MIETLRKHITDRLGQDLEHIDEVLLSFEAIKVKRGAQLLLQGDYCKYVYFVAKGSLQVYVFDKDLNETTRDIVVEGNWCTELQSFGSGKQANENIRAIEDSVLCAIHRDRFQHLVQTVPQFDKMYKQILEASYANSVYRINTFVSLSALERIQWLMEYRPGLMTRFSSKLIASYLGINKDVFSRLKSRL
jgi:CRP-like cAMP-binding protein